MFRTRLRRAKHVASDRVQRWVFSFCFGRLQRSTPGSPPTWLLKGLVRSWGNRTWSAEADYMAAGIRERNNRKGTSVECGSGLSTLVIAEAARRIGESHIAFEHDAAWCTRVSRCAEELGLHNLTVILAPLRDFGEFAWYDIDAELLPAEIPFVICDGPPGDTKGGRYGVLPVLRSRLSPGAVILADDSTRPAETEMLRRWSKEFGTVSTGFNARKPFARVQLPPTQS